MAYFYKKDFFGKWKRKNGISTAELSRVLEFNSPDKIRIWAGEKALPEVNNGKLKDEDRGWLPLKHILKLCNHYGLKISDFIENAEEPVPQKKKSDNKELEALRAELKDTELRHARELNTLHQEYSRTIQDLMKRIPEVPAHERMRSGSIAEYPKKD